MLSSLSELRIDFIPRPGNNVKSELNKVTKKCHLQPEPPLNQVAMSGYVLDSLHSGECNACTESYLVLFHKRDNKNMIKAYFLKARIWTPTIPQKNLNFPQICPKCHKIAQKWPKMTQNGPKWPKYDPKWPKMDLE